MAPENGRKGSAVRCAESGFNEAGAHGPGKRIEACVGDADVVASMRPGHMAPENKLFFYVAGSVNTLQ